MTFQTFGMLVKSFNHWCGCTSFTGSQGHWWFSSIGCDFSKTYARWCTWYRESTTDAFHDISRKVQVALIPCLVTVFSRSVNHYNSVLWVDACMTFVIIFCVYTQTSKHIHYTIIYIYTTDIYVHMIIYIFDVVDLHRNILHGRKPT